MSFSTSKTPSFRWNLGKHKQKWRYDSSFWNRTKITEQAIRLIEKIIQQQRNSVRKIDSWKRLVSPQEWTAHSVDRIGPILWRNVIQWQEHYEKSGNVSSKIIVSQKKQAQLFSQLVGDIMISNQRQSATKSKRAHSFQNTARNFENVSTDQTTHSWVWSSNR